MMFYLDPAYVLLMIVTLVISGGAQLFVLGLRFAAPVLAATMIANVALAVLTRAAPSLPGIAPDKTLIGPGPS